jgi:hypothetical protein
MLCYINAVASSLQVNDDSSRDGSGRSLDSAEGQWSIGFSLCSVHTLSDVPEIKPWAHPCSHLRGINHPECHSPNVQTAFPALERRAVKAGRFTYFVSSEGQPLRVPLEVASEDVRISLFSGVKFLFQQLDLFIAYFPSDWPVLVGPCQAEDYLIYKLPHFAVVLPLVFSKGILSKPFDNLRR